MIDEVVKWQALCSLHEESRFIGDSGYFTYGRVMRQFIAFYNRFKGHIIRASGDMLHFEFYPTDYYSYTITVRVRTDEATLAEMKAFTK